ncbi:MAG TPA: adenylate/guanylate cyclase domain-containing protein [Nitrososphaeraceae archaeon]|nr:adenylate/guanylate cyclase domain-containing protein [Nitrososphaeraceae archaeon]
MVEEISFTGSSKNCCISFIDIVDSTKITTTEINDAEKIRKYYSIFINTMAAIIRDFNATIIKNTGDSLLYYFPETSNNSSAAVDDDDGISVFKEIFECGLTMVEASTIINTKNQEEGLPALNYRISADYGRVEIAKSMTSTSDDLFGPTVSLCAKINSMAPINGMVIGRDLYEVTRSSPPSFDNDYYFSEIGKYPITELKYQHYPVYSIIRNKNKENNSKTLNLYKNVP